jgi:hypothetical protein
MAQTAQELVQTLSQLNDIEFKNFQTLYKRHCERRSLQLLDSYLEGDLVTFTTKGGNVIVAKVTKVALKNLKATEVKVNGAITLPRCVG